MRKATPAIASLAVLLMIIALAFCSSPRSSANDAQNVDKLQRLGSPASAR